MMIFHHDYHYLIQMDLLNHLLQTLYAVQVFKGLNFFDLHQYIVGVTVILNSTALTRFINYSRGWNVRAAFITG